MAFSAAWTPAGGFWVYGGALSLGETPSREEDAHPLPDGSKVCLVRPALNGACHRLTLPGATAFDPAAARGESFVVTHDQLRFDLIDCVHGDADHDQQRCSAEVEGDAQAV